jgi:hypothetical protein
MLIGTCAAGSPGPDWYIWATLTIRVQGLEPGSILCNGEMETDETSKCSQSEGSIHDKGIQ